MPRINFSSQQIEYIITQYLSGKTLKVIGEEMGVSVSPIKRILHENNIELRQSGSKPEDLTNRRFGKLTALYLDPNAVSGSGRHAKWICLCDCGKYVSVQSNHLKDGTQSACSSKCKHLIETNTKIGGLTVLEPTEQRNSSGAIIYHCLCDCGEHCYISSVELRAKRRGSCDKCKETYGEAKIRILLEQNNIAFEKEKTFEDCINPETQRKYRFDFYVNNCYVIEFDGAQHFIPIDYFGGEEYLEICQARDKIKNDYCREKHIPIIRIPYSHLENIVIEDLNPKSSQFLCK